MNREEWLTRAVEILRPMFADRCLIELPDEVAVSVGWPGGKSVNKVIGQCWTTATSDGVPAVFISPRLVDPVVVLATLAHELVHAWDDCKSGHKGAFTRAAKVFGLVGKMTATVASPELAEQLQIVADTIGPYPHRRVEPGEKLKPQTTRMVKVECACGYMVRTTRKWLDVGLPTCPCGYAMSEAA